MNFDTTGGFYGDILAFHRTGIDGVTNKAGNLSPVQLNGAMWLLAPEPGTAWLLGIGIFALACGGRARKS